MTPELIEDGRIVIMGVPLLEHGFGALLIQGLVRYSFQRRLLRRNIKVSPRPVFICLLAEAALLAERSDVEEELVRLRTHVERFLAMLDAGGELGKQLDFLLQELNREANTMLSKTSGATGEWAADYGAWAGDEGRDRAGAGAGAEP